MPLNPWFDGGDQTEAIQRERPFRVKKSYPKILRNRKRRRLMHDEQRIDANADLGCKGVADPSVNVLEKAVQGGIDDTLKFAFRRQFHPQSPLTARTLNQTGRRQCALRASRSRG